jgi:hypothetical protein
LPKGNGGDRNLRGGPLITLGAITRGEKHWARSWCAAKVASDRSKLAAALVLAIVAVIVLSRHLYINSQRDPQFDYSAYYNWGKQFRRGEHLWPIGPIGSSPHDKIRPGYPAGSRDQTPAFVEAFGLLTVLGPDGTYWAWQALLLLAVSLAIILLERSLQLAPDNRRTVGLTSLSAMSPLVADALYWSQLGPIILIAVVASWASSRREREWCAGVAGLCVACATLIKAYPGLLGGYFLCRRRWHVLAGG